MRALAMALLAAAPASMTAIGCGSGVEVYHPPGTGGNGTGGNAAATGGAGATGSGGTSANTGGAPATSTGGAAAATGGATATGTGGRAAGPGGSTGTGGTAVTGSGGSGTGRPPLLRLPWMDNFDAATTGSVPTGWLTDPADTVGKWTVAADGAGKVVQETVTVSSSSWLVGGDIAWTDQKVEARVKFAAVTSSSLALVAARFNDFDNYYFLNLKGDGSIKIRKRVLVGTSTSTIDVLTYKSGTALTAGTWYTVAIEIKGNAWTAYLNGAPVATMTEPAVSLARGGIALGFQDAAGSFDDVKVTLP